MSQSLNIAIQGCVHGELNKVYQSLDSLPNKPDILLVLGDFQSLRYPSDYSSISIPQKYIKLGDFPDYYSGKCKAPVLTIFIGGNHENFAQLADLPYGGWVAENIYYMGYSSVIWYRGLCIGGISGIYKHWDLLKPTRPESSVAVAGRWEEVVKSIYHVRMGDALPLLLLNRCRPTIMMSHDWPRGVEKYGNHSQLLRFKPHFIEDVRNGRLGSPIGWSILKHLQPAWWLSAHLHVRYEAEIEHTIISINEDELDLELSEDEIPCTKRTRFLALDKFKKDKNTHMDMINVGIDNQHPTAKKGCENMLFLDPEFVATLHYVKTDELGKRAQTQSLSEANIIALSMGVKVSDTIDWSKLKVPASSQELILNPECQTSYFRSIILDG